MNTSCQELVFKNDDKILEYKTKDKSDTFSLISKKTQRTITKIPDKVALYKTLLEREEFKRPESKEIVLDEDEYLSCLEEVIQKEYFPELYQLNKEKVKYLILTQQLNKKLANAQSVTGNHTKGYTNRTTNTAIDNLDKINRDYLEELKENKKQEKIEISMSNMSVNSFCMKYSSDELESLKDIIHKDKQKKLKRFYWMYECEQKANDKLKAIKDYTEHYLSLPDTEDKKFKIPLIITSETDAKNSLFFPPDFSNTNNRANIKMISSLDDLENEQNNFSRNINKNNNKLVLKDNCRFPENFVENINQLHSNKIKKQFYDAYESSDVVKLLHHLKEIDQKKEDEKILIEDNTPMIKGYKIIKEPIANPGKIDKNIPIFTYGEVASTPNILREKEVKGFTIQKNSNREELAHRLANKNIINKKKEIENKKNSMHIVKSSTKSYELTPSAMNLLNSVKRNSNIFDNSHGINKTPIPRKNTDTTIKNISSVLSIKTIKKK